MLYTGAIHPSKQQEGKQNGSSGADYICRLSGTVQDRGAVPGVFIPAAVSQRLCVPLLTSVTAGTVMHRTHLSLVLWFWAIYLCVNDKRGISASQLAKMLENGYESAWYLLKRIRKAMGQRDAKYLLSGLMEMDEGFFGGRKSGKRRRGTAQKKVIVALSKTSNTISQ